MLCRSSVAVVPLMIPVMVMLLRCWNSRVPVVVFESKSLLSDTKSA
jgi:hypothetical protein